MLSSIRFQHRLSNMPRICSAKYSHCKDATSIFDIGSFPDEATVSESETWRRCHHLKPCPIKVNCHLLIKFTHRGSSQDLALSLLSPVFETLIILLFNSFYLHIFRDYLSLSDLSSWNLTSFSIVHMIPASSWTTCVTVDRFFFFV